MWVALARRPRPSRGVARRQARRGRRSWPASGWSPASRDGRRPSRRRALIGQGKLAGVVLLQTRTSVEAWSRGGSIRKLQAHQAPRTTCRSAAPGHDRPGGRGSSERLSGAAGRVGAEMGQGGRAPQPPLQGAEDGARASSAVGRRTSTSRRCSTSAGAGSVDLAPSIAASARSSSPRACRHGDRRSRSRDAASHGVAATGKHFPGLGSAKRTPIIAVQKIRLSRSSASQRRRAPRTGRSPRAQVEIW